MDDPTLARVPVVLDAVQAVGVKVVPRCAACGTEIPDLSDPKHHVCVPAADGTLTRTTLDVSTAAWAAADAELRKKEASGS